MRRLLGLTGFLAFAAIAGLYNRASSAASALPPPQGVQTISCASDDKQRHHCDADTRGGVQLIRQRSESPCSFGQTWGYDDHGVWVDRGCRGEFQTGGVNWGGWETTYTIYCASDDMGRSFCATNTRYGVRLARQRSESECVYGRTWGYNGRGVWVDRGCRADFELGTPEWYRNAPIRTVSCSSDDMGLHFCQADANQGARLVRQRSDSDCIYGTTWGFDDRGIWVDRGCRADFELGSGDGDNDRDDQPYTQRVYCASDDMHRHACFADARAGVRLVRQRSESECVQGRTWGYDRRGIWVDRGCRAEFEVAVGRSRSGSETPSTVYCASEDMHRHGCPADTNRGVRLVRQRSGSECIEGRTWGYNEREIWVDRGCRAEFELGRPR